MEGVDVGADVAADRGPVRVGRRRVVAIVSKPRIEGAPITFTASGVAPGPVDGESTDFLQGAVIHQYKSCPPGGANISGDIPGTVVSTVHAFPTGSFDKSARVAPTGLDPQSLVAGKWRECVYLQDRGTNAVTAFAQEDFTVRRAHVGVHVVKVPRHLDFHDDPQGRPNAVGTVVVRARAEVPLRTVQILVQAPGERRSCLQDLTHSHYGGISIQSHRIKAGRARAYRLRTQFVFKAGAPPYGKRVRVCAIVGYNDPTAEALIPEGLAQSRVVIRR